jgi:hypothetical protein
MSETAKSAKRSKIRLERVSEQVGYPDTRNFGKKCPKFSVNVELSLIPSLNIRSRFERFLSC